jgi:hypothetical protein
MGRPAYSQSSDEPASPLEVLLEPDHRADCDPQLEGLSTRPEVAGQVKRAQKGGGGM